MYWVWYIYLANFPVISAGNFGLMRNIEGTQPARSNINWENYAPGVHVPRVRPWLYLNVLLALAVACAGKPAPGAPTATQDPRIDFFKTQVAAVVSTPDPTIVKLATDVVKYATETGPVPCKTAAFPYSATVAPGGRFSVGGYKYAIDPEETGLIRGLEPIPAGSPFNFSFQAIGECTRAANLTFGTILNPDNTITVLDYNPIVIPTPLPR